jgi:hypothetical protein
MFLLTVLFIVSIALFGQSQAEPAKTVRPHIVELPNRLPRVATTYECASFGNVCHQIREVGS